MMCNIIFEFYILPSCFTVGIILPRSGLLKFEWIGPRSLWSQNRRGGGKVYLLQAKSQQKGLRPLLTLAKAATTPNYTETHFYPFFHQFWYFLMQKEEKVAKWISAFGCASTKLVEIHNNVLRTGLHYFKKLLVSKFFCLIAKGTLWHASWRPGYCIEWRLPPPPSCSFYWLW